MALVEIRKLRAGTFLCIWKIEEPESFFHEELWLDDDEKSFLASISNVGRRLQWLGSRLLIRRIINPKGQILMDWDSFGKPVIVNYDFEVSISHCRDMVTVIVGDRKTGIDIEQRSNKIDRIAHKFVNEDEAHFINDQRRTDYYLIIWACKETLFKYVGGGGIDFKKHLHVLPFDVGDKGPIDMYYDKFDRKDYTLNYEWVDDHIMVYCV